MPSWEQTEHYEIVNEEVEDIPEITSTGKNTCFVTTSKSLSNCYNFVFLFHCFLVITVWENNLKDISS